MTLNKLGLMSGREFSIHLQLPTLVVPMMNRGVGMIGSSEVRSILSVILLSYAVLGVAESVDADTGTSRLLDAVVADQKKDSPVELRSAFDSWMRENQGGEVASDDLEILTIFINHLITWEGRDGYEHYFTNLSSIKYSASSCDDAPFLNSLNKLEALALKDDADRNRFRINRRNEILAFEEIAFKQVESLLDGYGIEVFGLEESMRRAGAILDSGILHDKNREEALRATLLLKDANVGLLDVYEQIKKIELGDLIKSGHEHFLYQQIEGHIAMNEAIIGPKFKKSAKYTYLKLKLRKMKEMKDGSRSDVASMESAKLSE